MKYSVLTEVEIDDEFIEDAIIDTAGYGIYGIASSAIVDSDARTYSVRFYDSHATVTASYDAIAEAFIDLSMGKVQARSDIVEAAASTIRELQNGEPFAGGDIDSEVASVIVQVAFFGKIVYG